MDQHDNPAVEPEEEDMADGELNNNDAQGNNIAEEVEEEGDGIPRLNPNTFDGGSSVEGKKSSSDCDITLFLECNEVLESHENHPILASPHAVAVGLDKTTKLRSVFLRYVEFCNQHRGSDPQLCSKRIEFVHCTLLNPSDTAEASALMKNDRIRVQNIRQDERDAVHQLKKLQHEADRNFFEQLQNLMPDTKTGATTCNVLLDCQGKVIDENGLNQKLLRTGLRAHSSILSQRCKWLGRLIQQARDELGRKSVVTIPDHECCKEERSPLARTESDDDGFVVPFPAVQRNTHSEGAAEIENDDDEELDAVVVAGRSGSPILPSSPTDLLWVPIPYPPDAVRILIEYCYTNRVPKLGREAFEIASHPNHHEAGAPVLPTDRQWPDKGRDPQISFEVAVSAISLAEEASLSRLSLMCEVAASLLVEPKHVVEALSVCSVQEQETGNSLPRLRKAAMAHVLRNANHGGCDDVCRTPTFLLALQDKSAVLVPSLLKGTAEIITATLPTTDDEEVHNVCTDELDEYFKQIDKEDKILRARERGDHKTGKRKVATPDPDDEGWVYDCRPSPQKKPKNRNQSAGRNSKHSRHSRRLKSARGSSNSSSRH